jgi:hypothetical protein
MTYVDTQVLSRDMLQTVLANFPVSNRKVRRASLLLALRRHMMWSAKETKLFMVTAQASASQGESKGDFLDRIHTASGTVSEAQANSVKMAVTLEKDLNMRRRRGKGGPIADDGSAEEGLSSVEVAPAGFHTEMMDGMRSMREAIKQLQDQMREMHAQMGKR